jgi:hypothetical protein
MSNKMIMFVMSDGSKTIATLEAWARAGVTGATILDSSGIAHTVKQMATHDDLPLIPSLRAILRTQEHTNRMLFSVVEESFNIAELVRVTEEVIGSLSVPHVGILIVLPVIEVYGFHKHEKLFEE